MPCSSAASARRTSPGLMPCAPRLREVDLDLEVRLARRQLDTRVRDAVDPGHELLHPRGLAAQDVLLLAEHAHGERLVGAGQHVEAVAA